MNTAYPYQNVKEESFMRVFSRLFLSSVTNLAFLEAIDSSDKYIFTVMCFFTNSQIIIKLYDITIIVCVPPFRMIFTQTQYFMLLLQTASSHQHSFTSNHSYYSNKDIAINLPQVDSESTFSRSSCRRRAIHHCNSIVFIIQFTPLFVVPVFFDLNSYP